jgi:hygromycin-B 4-O-kinase
MARHERRPGDGAALRQVRAIIAHHLGPAPRRVSVQRGGLTNRVFLVEHRTGDLIIRMGRGAAKLHHFLKEQWATARAREAGIPTPHILEVGNDLGPFTYMIQRRVAGRPATDHPDRLRILRELGRYAAGINRIRTVGFGSTFDWSDNELSRNACWRDFLAGEFGLRRRLELLARQRMLPAARLRALRATVEAGAGACGPRLVHGDLRLKNVLVDDEGAIVAIIDWEDCSSNLAPQWELSIALHDLSIDAKEALIAGYGLSPAGLKRAAPLMKALNILNYADDIARAVEAGDEAGLDRYRMRLAGMFDLYSP